MMSRGALINKIFSDRSQALNCSLFLLGKRGLLVLCIMLSGISVWAEGQSIKGGVRSGREPVVGASVVLLSLQDSTMLSFAYTTAEGSFDIKLKKPNLSRAMLSVRCLGYKPYTQILDFSLSKPLDINIEKDTHLLQEVVVKASPVWGERDSINYNVARLIRAGDRSIGDVIRHIPGMRIQGEQIEYQGKPIKQINIEGIDLTQGDYGALTSNIDARDITTIQVLDNYQGIKALVGKRSSDDVVLNLKMSPKKRGVWGVALDLGAGYGDGIETNSRVRASHFARKSQFLGVAYADNSGREDYDRLRRSGRVQSDGLFAHVGKPATPNLPPAYYIDNTSLLASGNRAFVLTDGSQLQMQGSYRYDKLHTEGSSLSNYEGEHASIVTDENIQHRLQRHAVVGGLSYEKNLQQYYIKDKLKVYLSQGNTLGTIELNQSAHPQRHRLNNLSLSNQVHYINTQHVLPIEVLLSQDLKILDEDFMTSNSKLIDLLSHLTERQSTLNQAGKLISFKTDNRFQIPSLHLARYWRYQPQVTASYLLQRLSSHNPFDVYRQSQDNTLRIETEQTLSYLRGHQSIDLSLPVIYQLRTTSHDRLVGLLFEPRLKIKFSLGDNWGVNVSGHYVHNEPTIETWYPFAVLRDYRSLTTGTPHLYRERAVRLDGLLDYRNIFSFLSSSLRVNYSVGYKPFVQMLYLDSSGGRYELLAHKHYTQTLSSLWSISKGFIWWSLGLDLDLGYVYHKGVSAYQGHTSPYDHQTASTRFALKASPTKAILIDYNLYYGHNQTNGSSNHTDSDDLLSQTIRVGLTLSKGLFWDVTMEHNHIKSSESQVDATLFGSEISWRGPTLDLSCELSNLLNVQNYHSVRRLSYATLYHSYRLRPRSILLKASFKL